MDDKAKLLARLHDIEKEVERVRAQLAPPQRRGKVLSWGKMLYGFTISNWVFATFISGFLIAGFVKYKYGVNYFEDYQNIATNKRSAEFYQRLGDKLMEYGEIEAAEDAYNTALKINPHNVDATRGVLKTQIFRPPSGQKYYIPDLVDAKLEYLDNLLKEDAARYEAKDKYVISFFKAHRYLAQGNYEEAKKWYENSIKQNPDFIAGYISVGYASTMNGEGIDLAMENFRRALEKDQDYANALHNLGYCYIIKTDFKKAIEYLNRAYSISPSLEATINLGDSYRYLGDAHEASQWHLYALGMVTNPKIEEDRAVAPELALNFMPETPGDVETPKQVVEITDMDQKRTLVRYSLSFDYALMNNFTEADKEFNLALELDKNHYLNSFIANKILSIENFTQPGLARQVKVWFENKRARLTTRK